MQEDTQGLSPKSLIAVREGIEAARVVSMGVLATVGGKLTDTAFYRPGGGYDPASKLTGLYRKASVSTYE